MINTLNFSTHSVFLSLTNVHYNAASRYCIHYSNLCILGILIVLNSFGLGQFNWMEVLESGDIYHRKFLFVENFLWGILYGELYYAEELFVSVAFTLKYLWLHFLFKIVLNIMTKEWKLGQMRLTRINI